jgi:signal transduction histidine kinase/CheY-like chemotaxis protein
MATPLALAHDADYVHREMDDLRHWLLPVFLVALPVVAWIWYGYIILQVLPLGRNLLPCVVLVVGSGVAALLRNHSFHLAGWAVVLSLCGTILLSLSMAPFSLAGAFGMVVILSAHVLLGPWPAALVGLAYAAVSLPILARATDGSGNWLNHWLLLTALDVQTLGLIFLATRPLGTAVEWALSGWDHAREALAETRERRGEIYRVMRALDEATYRIQRMNNELVVARHEAEVARSLKARFTATVSHELRAPLNLILGYSSMMVLSPERYAEPLPVDYLPDVDAIYRNSQHLATLVNDILDLSQIEAQRLPLLKDETDYARDVVDKAVELMRPLAERKGLRLLAEVPDGLPLLYVDNVRMRQVLLNLLNNAIRFTERGSVVVTVSLREECLVTAVRDTGPGIAAELLPSLFQEFRQIALTETREEAGSGLGLSISKHLVELHGGRIQVESTKGVGSTFSYTVPLLEDQPLRTVSEGTADQRVPPGRTRAMADPVALAVGYQSQFVRLLGHQLGNLHVVGVSGLREGMDLIGELHPRAVVAPASLAAELAAMLEDLPFDLPIISLELPNMTLEDAPRQILSHLVKPITAEMVRAVMAKVHHVAAPQVLIVDDEPDAVRLIEAMLTALPNTYRITRAYDGRQALNAMQQRRPDVVFVDLIMPQMDGNQLIEAMRRDPHLEDVPVVIVSAQDALEEGLWLQAPMVVRFKRALGIARGLSCLRGLIDSVPASYLPET